MARERTPAADRRRHTPRSEIHSEANAICNSMANPTRRIARSAGSIAAATDAGHACTYHCSGLLALLKCPHDKKAVQRAVDGWQAEALETAAAEAGLAVTACRSFAEWDEHPQGRAVAALPVFTIEQIGDAPSKPLAPADRPLSGIKALDLTRIIAGPVCGRTLAAHGADVMLVTAPHLASLFPLVVDTGRGKLSASLDLREQSSRETSRCCAMLTSLCRATARRSRFGRPRIAPASRHHLVRSVPSAVGPGPRAMASTFAGANRGGFNIAKPKPSAKASRAHCRTRNRPRPDTAGVTMAALARRAERGGHGVRCSLAQTGHWFRQLGRVDGMACPDPNSRRDRLRRTRRRICLTAVRHQRPWRTPRWVRPTVLGTDPRHGQRRSRP